MRCKSCDKDMTRADLVTNPHTGYVEDMCSNCRGISFASINPEIYEENEDASEREDITQTVDQTSTIGYSSGSV